MPYDQLLIEYDEEDGWITLRRGQGPSGKSSQATFQVRSGFALSDVIEALRATTWVVERNGAFWLEGAVTCRALAEIVAEMLFYFDAPNVPSGRLLGIKRHVDALCAELNVAREMDLWTCAWLDVIVHADLADAALAADDVWAAPTLTLDLQRSRNRRLEEVRERLAELPPQSDEALAPSSRSRRLRSDREQQTG